jgi:hypothetical protein
MVSASTPFSSMNASAARAITSAVPVERAMKATVSRPACPLPRATESKQN